MVVLTVTRLAARGGLERLATLGAGDGVVVSNAALLTVHVPARCKTSTCRHQQHSNLKRCHDNVSTVHQDGE